MNDLDSTQIYINENEHILTLPKFIANGKLRKAYPNSVLWLAYKKISSIKNIFYYSLSVLKNWKWVMGIVKLKGKSRLKKVIVIGNGPSQGMLNITKLIEFQNKGGELICINFWTENEKLNQIIPNYLVISDPLTLSPSCPEYLAEKNKRLHSYLLKNNSIKIIAPIEQCKRLSNIFGMIRIIGYVDHDLRYWTKNIKPIYPRGYFSMTLYKALALALWFEYEEIYIIGMDNTYPRNIYCDKDNKILNHEIHAGTNDFVMDFSTVYNNMGDAIYDIAALFYDIQNFKNGKIFNLDPFSLTDTFKKIYSPIVELKK